MLPGRTDDVIIGTLRVRADVDTPLVRAGVRADVRRCSLRPAGLSPNAVLVVRHLGGRLDGEHGPSVLDRRRWIEHPADALDSLLRTALRPARDGVRPSPPAVLFEDRIELLTVYLEQLRQGNAGRFWWLLSLRSQFGLADTIAAVLLDAAEFVPEVFASMGPNRVETLVATLPPGESLQVAVAVAEAHGGHELAEVVQRRIRTRSSSGSADDDQVERRIDDGDRSPLPPPPWLPVARGLGAGSGLAAPHRLLIGVAAVASNRGAVLRTPDFASAVDSWLAGWLPDGTAPVDAGVGFDGGHHDGSPHGVEQYPAGNDAAIRRAGRTSETPSGSVDQPNVRRLVPQEDGTGTTTATRPRRPVESPVEPRLSGRSDSGGAGRRAAPGNRVDRTADAAITGAVIPVDGVFSELAGGFLLIGLLERLGLPERFEADHRLDSSVGAWPLLAAILRGLLDIDRYHDDPIWPVLTELAGGISPFDVDHAVPPDVPFRCPPDWLDLLDHPAQPPAPSFDLRPTLAAGLDGGLGHWLSEALPVVRRIAESLLGVGPDDLVAECVERRGRIRFDRTHVDVTLPLARVSLAVRRAGLDRNPGWIAGFGRVITFHFE